MATLLEIIQDIADEIQLPRPTTVMGNTDLTVRGLLVNANREGRELSEAARWTALQRLHSFDTVQGQEEYAFPDDFNRIVPDTEWDDDERFPLRGPVSMQGWRILKVSLLGGGVVGKRYRVYRSLSSTDRRIFIDPVPGASDAGDTLSFFYMSKNWLVSADGQDSRDRWGMDDDVLLLDEDLYKLGTIVRYKRSKGLEFASETDEYNQMFGRLVAQDRPGRTLGITGRRGSFLIGRANIPETFPIS